MSTSQSNATMNAFHSFTLVIKETHVHPANLTCLSSSQYKYVVKEVDFSNVNISEKYLFANEN